MSFFSKAKKSVKKLVKHVVGGSIVGNLLGIGCVAGVALSLVTNHSSSSSSTNSGSVTTVQNDVNVYMPAMNISFDGELFKPSTRIYVFFDGKDISAYVTPTGGTMGAPLVSTTSGHISGVISIPNNDSIRFIQGKKQIKFTDSSKNDGTETTFAETYFTYSGNQDQTNYQDLGGIQTSTPTADPMVQSFMILDNGGIYLSSVDLYFLAKDTQYPILFQIREVVEDSVSSAYLANSNYILKPNEINISGDGSVATTITLSSPVYLQEGKEYAIYLFTNAPSTYNLATCVYGQTNTYNQLSTKDPRIGSLMKYLGSDAWLRDNSRGLKFTLNKCAFDTSRAYTLALDNVQLNTKLLENNSISTTNGTNIITIKDKGHSFNIGDYVTVQGLPENTQYGGINSNYINGIHRIDSITWDTYSFSTVMISGTETIIPDTAVSTVSFGINITTDYGYQYDVLLLNNNEMVLSNSNLSYTYKGLSGQSLDGNETPNVFDSGFTEVTNKIDYNTARVKKVNSPYNEANINPGSARSLQIDVAFKTSNENITPVIDASNTNAILVENLINNQYTDEINDSGNGIARYITKDVALRAQSNGIQVRFSANVQGNADVRVFYKILPIGSTGTLADQPWVQMELDNEVSKAINEFTYNDYIYTKQDLPLFRAFKTKVLMTSPDSTKPPLIKVYRAIAFQSVNNE